MTAPVWGSPDLLARAKDDRTTLTYEEALAVLARIPRRWRLYERLYGAPKLRVRTPDDTCPVCVLAGVEGNSLSRDVYRRARLDADTAERLVAAADQMVPAGLLDEIPMSAQDRARDRALLLEACGHPLTPAQDMAIDRIATHWGMMRSELQITPAFGNDPVVMVVVPPTRKLDVEMGRWYTAAGITLGVELDGYTHS